MREGGGKKVQRLNEELENAKYEAEASKEEACAVSETMRALQTQLLASRSLRFLISQPVS